MTRAYPFDRLPRLTRGQAALESALARHLAARPTTDRLAALAGPVRVIAIRAGGAPDAHAAMCELRVGGQRIEVRGSSRGVRRLAQRLLGGPAELDAPRPLMLVEERLWAHVVSLAIDDLGIAGEVIAANPLRRREPRAPVVSIDVVLGEIAVVVELAGDALELAVPPRRPWPAWVDSPLDVPVVIGRCALPREAVARLAVRDIVTIEPALELEIFGGAVGLRAPPGAVSATVASGYVARDMSLPDDASCELTVALGTTQLTVRQVLDLAVGQIVQLGRPLAGPFELRALGRVVGRGELVDVDGELGVRIVSLES